MVETKNLDLVSPVRVERDLIGEKVLPARAYYGIQTARALENFNISGLPIRHYPNFISALAMVKLAAARANAILGQLDPTIAQAIEVACQEIMAGQLRDQFNLDVFQGGAGTSTNMNANEVIANRALELLGKKKGEYEFCSPHDHVNLSQSTNDVYPSSLRLALVLGNVQMLGQLRALIAAFRLKAQEFSHILKMGRTQLQDAVPMTLGQEFEAWARNLEDEVLSLTKVEELLLEVNMGGTAIGTGLNAPRGYSKQCVFFLGQLMGKPVRLAENLIEATQDTQAYTVYSSSLKSLSIKLSKICNDLRLLSSGPRAGLHEINLPALQPGSSIMPGKVNPVIPEVVNMVCFRVIGSDVTISFAAEAGQLQLNVMEPVIAVCLFEGQMLLSNAFQTLRKFCVEGITANADVCRMFIEHSIGLVTALNPLIGYTNATELATEALRSGKGIVELVRERKLLTEEQIRQLLDPAKMVGGGG